MGAALTGAGHAAGVTGPDYRASPFHSGCQTLTVPVPAPPRPACPPPPGRAQEGRTSGKEQREGRTALRRARFRAARLHPHPVPALHPSGPEITPRRWPHTVNVANPTAPISPPFGASPSLPSRQRTDPGLQPIPPRLAPPGAVPHRSRSASAPIPAHPTPEASCLTACPHGPHVPDSEQSGPESISPRLRQRRPSCPTGSRQRGPAPRQG